MDRAIAQDDPIFGLELLGDACDVVVYLLLQLANVVRMDVDQRAELRAGDEMRVGLQFKSLPHHG
jgi:hypothetical protein